MTCEALAPDTRGVSCRLCGAVRAPKGEYALCDTCWGRYQHFALGLTNGKDWEYKEDVFCSFLAHELIKGVQRAKTYGVNHRCEAITTSPYFNMGYQCGRFASMKRDGRHCCHSHGVKAQNVTFVDSDIARDWYEHVEEQVRALSKRDTRFRAAIESALGRNG